MTAVCLTFDTLDFVKKLEAVGVEPRVAEVYASLQAELQAQVLEKQAQANDQILSKFEEYRPILDEIKVTKHEFATKSDILILRNELKADISNLRNELIIKLGGIIVGTSAILGVIIALFH